MNPRVHRIADVARLTGVSARTLRHYDQIGLLVPSQRSAAGYRLYTSGDLLRLQQILIGRSLGLALEAIRRLLDEPGLDRRELLTQQRRVLVERARATDAMIRSIDAALALLSSDSPVEVPVDSKDLFNGFEPAAYEEEARQRWGGTEAWRQSRERTRKYGPAHWRVIKGEWQALMSSAAAALAAQEAPGGPHAMDLAEGYRLWLERWFFACPPAMHAGFAAMLEGDPRFAGAVEQHAGGLAAWWAAAIRANAARPR